MAQLELRNLTKAFKTGVVLDDVSLAADPGEIVAVFGPSGTGKTVLLRLVAGVQDPDAGAILIEGRDVTDESPDRRGVGMAFQNFALFPHMSAYDNVASALTALGAPASTIKDKVGAIVRLLKIDHVMGHSPRELSNGQKQRTALARALVAGPKVLLLDDPLRNVDAKLRYEMRLELPNVLRRFGSTVLYVTQDYKEAMALADRIAVLLGGKLAQVATPAEIYERPATVEVARLFGDPTINLIPVKPVRENGGVGITIANTRMALSPRYADAAGRDCLLGLRCESVRISAEPLAGSAPVEVLAQTPLNEKTVLLARTADGQEVLASVPSGAPAPQPGPAHLAIDPEAALLFDRESGARIARSGEGRP
jgi:multiple sugar transport system ATP-binding protein